MVIKTGFTVGRDEYVDPVVTRWHNNRIKVICNSVLSLMRSKLVINNRFFTNGVGLPLELDRSIVRDI